MLDQMKIFVVEDEPMIQDVLEDALTDAGFAVAVASSGEDAAARLDSEGDQFRAMVTDVNFAPGKMTGWDVARHARERRSDLPVIYMTGAAADQWAQLGVPGSVLVSKPFIVMQIIIALSGLLNKAGGSGPVAAG